MREKTLSNRRRFLKLAGGAAAAAAMLSALPRRVMAALQHLSITNDPTAKALHYVEDNTKAVAPH